ncbi:MULTISPECIES: DUF4402 domain-containing protein [Pseudoalteromonas]|nr:MULTISPECIES: DUF4402 domain-containing protein [Pseudoalteromonas]NLR13987.1 DUF4402 domain-containing protein [Pseudoalteromonas peptidolytica]RXE97489.1 DUF4402 domain-containing protein [Pseudoalteromonas sp. PS5]GEK11150.1 hypothetical protein PPE03_33990 [Pseudoalteromonas peptidolytica]
MKGLKFFAFATMLSGMSHASSIEVLQNLNFGIIVAYENSRESILNMTPYGEVSSTNELYIFKRGEPAVVQLKGFPANKQIYISDCRCEVKIQNQHSSNFFLIKRLNLVDKAFTDVYGEAEIKIGAILATSGNGQPYVDGSYTGKVSIVIEY